jgi:hypothetical protein
LYGFTQDAATLITQSLHHVLEAGEKLKQRYTRLTKYKKQGLVGTGLRRKVFGEMYQMLKKGEYHYGRDAEKHEAKLLQYKRLLKKSKKTLETA